MESNICFVSFFRNFHWFYVLFSNHLYGQNILHVDVYDEDSVKNEKIGSIQIDLHELYEKSLFQRKIIYSIDFILC